MDNGLVVKESSAHVKAVLVLIDKTDRYLSSSMSLSLSLSVSLSGAKEAESSHGVRRQV